MAQIKTGLVSVTNGSNTVTGNSTEFTLANVGSLFIVQGDAIAYTIASIVSDTSLTLSVPYGGTTDVLTGYTIHTTRTPVNNLPYPTTGDVETAIIVAEAIKKLDSGFAQLPPSDNQTYAIRNGQYVVIIV